MNLRSLLVCVTSSAVFSFVCVAAALADKERLDDIRTQGHFHARLIRSMEYSFEVIDDKGWKARVDFYAEGTRFRVDRHDITGQWIVNRRIEPSQMSAAYDDQRYQLYTSKPSTLLLKDGSHSARYSNGTPHTRMYGWLRMPDMLPVRWDKNVNGTIWENRFRDAVYKGQVQDNGMELEVVEFPRRDLRTPFIYKVYFAPRLGYMPVKYVRRVEQTGETSSTMEVTRFREFVVDGRRVGLQPAHNPPRFISF
jgi:hypothetical protein